MRKMFITKIEYEVLIGDVETDEKSLEIYHQINNIIKDLDGLPYDLLRVAFSRLLPQHTVLLAAASGIDEPTIPHYYYDEAGGRYIDNGVERWITDEPNED